MTDPQSTFGIDITHHTLVVPGMPESLAGSRLIHLTDFHCGNGGSSHLLMEIVRRTNLLAPDLVALTGDYVDHYQRDVPQIVEILSCLTSTRGVYACLGN